MSQAQIAVKPRAFGETQRPDAWWVQPLLVFLLLSSFVVYAPWAALQGDQYHWGPYLSPFYSPEKSFGATTGSAIATSRSAARRSARRGSRSRTTPSSRSRSESWTGSTIRCGGPSGCSAAALDL